jgi:hypothetical protein
MLETHTNEDHINVHRLSLEIPERKREPHFDREKEVTAEDWKHILEEFDRSRLSRARDFTVLAYRIARLDRTKLPALAYDDDWYHVANELDRYRRRNDTWGIISQAEMMRVLFPERPPTVAPHELAAIEQRTEAHRADHHWLLFIENVACAAPWREKKTIIEDEEWHAIVNKAQHLLQGNVSERQVAIPMMSNILAVDPARISMLALTDEDWFGMKNVLQKRRESEDWSNFAFDAGDLYLLSQAEQAMWKKEKILDEDPPLPEVLNFEKQKR